VQEAQFTQSQDGYRGFRSQLPLPELQKLFDYWLARHPDGALPSRADIDPVHIPSLLPGICLMEISHPDLKAKVRLAGTRLREGYGMELTGRMLDEALPPGEARYWQAVAHRVAVQRKPAYGVTRNVWEDRPTFHQVWLRLPLAGENGEVAMMIGYDAFLLSKKADALVKDPGKIVQIA
jgi:hypothetical protein